MANFNKTPENAQYGIKVICGVQTFSTHYNSILYENVNYKVEYGICEEKKRAYAKVSPKNEKVELAIIDEIEDENNKLHVPNFERIIKKLNNIKKTYASDLTGGIF